MKASYYPQIGLDELRELVRQGEGQHLEFKLKTHHPDKIVKEICAFANASGGKLLIGISDNRDIEGCKHPEEDMYIMQRAIEKYLGADLVYHLKITPLDNERAVLIYQVPPAALKPISVKDEGQETVYFRAKDKSIQASKELREVLKASKKVKNYSFNYGDKEQKLMQFLENNGEIQLAQFAELANISNKIASKTLILLTLAGVLRLNPTEHGDVYKRAT